MRITNMFRAASVALALLLALPFAARAQTVTSAPAFVAARAVNDLGNGPTELRVLQGSMGLFTSQSSGTASTTATASTTLTLATTPLTVPCVGCVLSGTGILSGTTVASYSGVTIGMSSAQVVTSTTVSWGAACPAAPPTAPVALVQANVGADIPMYTQARVCVYGGVGPGAQYLTFAIGAH